MTVERGYKINLRRRGGQKRQYRRDVYDLSLEAWELCHMKKGGQVIPGR